MTWRRIGFGAPSTTLQSFLRWSSRSSYHRRPRKLLASGSSSCELRSVSRVSRDQPTTRRLRLGGSSHEVLRLIAPSTSRVRRHDGFHATAAVRPQVFATSRRFAPRAALRACSIPLARPGFSLQGFSLAGSRHGSSPQPCLHAVTACIAPLAGRSSRSSASRPCSPGESVARRPAVKRSVRPIPSWASSSPGHRFTSAVDRASTILPSRASPRTRTGRVLRRSTGSHRTEGWAVSRETTSPLEVPGLFDSSCVRARFGPGLSFRLGRDAASPRHRAHLCGPSPFPTGAA